MYDIHFLKSEAREKICKNFSSVIRSQDFLGLPLERVTHILSFSDAKLVHILNLKMFVPYKREQFWTSGRAIYKMMNMCKTSSQSATPVSLCKSE